MMENQNKNKWKLFQIFFILFYILSTVKLISSQFTDETYSVQPTPVLSNNDDLTTVLLVDNNNRVAHGRYLNVKPAIGLLTSTTRTFIHEGATTEYATQVIGTTIDNGRLYAQLLKKSSRIIYERPISVTNSDSHLTSNTKSTISPSQIQTYNPSQNDIIDNDQFWQLNDDHLINIDSNSNLNNFIINTDFVQPLKNTVQFIYPNRSYNIYDDENNKNTETKEIKASYIRPSQKFLHNNNNNNNNNSNENQATILSNNFNKSNSKKIISDKVQPAANLPTFTVKNVFSPSGFSFDNPRLDEKTERSNIKSDMRLAKSLYRGNSKMQKNDKYLETVTYFGFADFITTVADTVIVFSPNTQELNLQSGHITSIKGEATLSTNNVLQSQLTKSKIEPTITMKPILKIIPTNSIILDTKSNSNEDDDDIDDIFESDTTTQFNDILYDTTTPNKIIDEITENDEFIITPSIENSIESSMQSIDEKSSIQLQSNQIPVILSTPSNEDISRIFASLASAEAIKKLDKQKSLKSTENIKIESETSVSGGVTTIFFENDPFDAFDSSTKIISPSLSSEIKKHNTDTFNRVNNEITTTSESLTTEENTTINDIDDNADETTLPIEEIITTTPISNDIIDEENNSNKCNSLTSEIIPTLVQQTQLHLTTFLISTLDTVTTSIETNTIVTFDVSYTTTFNCENTKNFDAIVGTNENILPTKIIPDNVVSVSDKTDKNVENVDKNNDQIVNNYTTSETPIEVTTIQNSVDKNITETTIEEIYNENDDDVDDIGNEESDTDTDDDFELIYKTLYTTYTYLTTFFHESTTSISSRKEVITNVITSTINPLQQSSLIDEIKDKENISPTSLLNNNNNDETSVINIGIGRPTTSFTVSQSDLNKIDEILDQNLDKGTTPLNDDTIKNGLKTYYTTYTYFTTIFVDGESEITSRTEVYTNYVTDKDNNDVTILPIRNQLKISDSENNIYDIKPTSMYETILRSSTPQFNILNDLSDLDISSTNNEKFTYRTLTQNKDLESSGIITDNIDSENTENTIKLVTDVKLSSSGGHRQIIDNRNLNNEYLDDQVSSESNTEDILPSPTLLLQTSFTTFTYFTTMYIGSTSSNILSRLETITNVVTETLKPTKSLLLSENELTLPIIYFTTFTYWTTLIKDGEITTISREETISNIVTPTNIIPTSLSSELLMTTISPTTSILPNIYNNENETATINTAITTTTTTTTTPTPTLDNSVMNTLETETYFTTYTYFTTSYVGDQTVLNSRLETFTNIIITTPTLSAIVENSTGIINFNQSKIIDENNNNMTILEKFEPVFMHTINKTIDISPIKTNLTNNKNLISINEGKIIDAEGISTLYYKTSVISTEIDGKPTQIISSTSSINIDEIKRLLSTPSTDINGSSKTYKTGLVRLIEGTMIANHTTTLYKSKVIGTIIDDRYAQIIESTSSYIIEKTIEPTTISPTITSTDIIQTTSSVSLIEGSIIEDNDNKDSDNQNSQIQKTTSSIFNKKTVSPVIRPFAPRNRPKFAPKRRITSSATIITRSDFTPTITATPALKFENTRVRYNNNRKNNQISSSFTPNSFSSLRKFSRTRSYASSPSSIGPSSSSSSLSGGFGSSRNRFSSSRIQPSFSYLGSSSRQHGNPYGRGSSTINRSLSSVYNIRSRIKPTLSANLNTISATFTTESTEQDENNTQNIEKQNEEEDIQTTTENHRHYQNPLLKFRRPALIGRTNSLNSGSRNGQQGLKKQASFSQRNKSTIPTTTTTTTPFKPHSRGFQRPTLASYSNRTRASDRLFPPRGLFGQQNIEKDKDEVIKNSEDEKITDSQEDNDYSDNYEGENLEVGERNERQRRSNFRIKRQIEYNNSRNYRNRFRRPTTKMPAYAEERVDNIVIESEQGVTQKVRKTTTRQQGRKYPQQLTLNSSRIRPTKPFVPSRIPFTLREKDIITNLSSKRSTSFRRPTVAGGISSTHRPQITNIRPKTPRIKSYTNSANDEYSLRSTSRSRQINNRARGINRSRSRNQVIDPNHHIKPSFDGTITVSHHVPTVISIPIVSGKITDFKNIVTSKLSTEILSPRQYTTIIDKNDKSVLALTREDTTINNNGLTEITQYIIHETLTTSITFTPTTIRGRLTSFSHIIPSTIYDIENVITTIKPQIAANAPLANLLLSQLLLGNIGLQPQSLNSLIGLGVGGQQQQQQILITPTTEYKTRTTTYITTVTDKKSTVIPLTFRGKEILTTIHDSSLNIITATEYLTETIVVTPTMQPAAVQQVNSLLLPLLLQQQQQQQQQQQLQQLQIQSNPLLSNINNQNQFLLPQHQIELDNGIYKEILDDSELIKSNVENLESDNYKDIEDDFKKQTSQESRKRNRKIHKSILVEPSSQHRESSIITLYVSGRRPGEFSTILSTVYNTPTTIQKREIESLSTINNYDFYKAEESELHEKYLYPAINDILINDYSTTPSMETQNLESVVGDVTQSTMDSTTINMKLENLDNEQGNFRFFDYMGFTIGPSIKNIDFKLIEPSTSTTFIEEARYNLATRIMSNGVEVIVAGDKNKLNNKQSVLRILPSNLYKPMTLTPSTVKDQMILIVPSNKQDNISINLNQNQFITKTCLTTYTYRTTYLQDGTKMIQSREKVISNIATEERNFQTNTPTDNSDIQNPEMVTDAYHQTHTYLNTIKDEDYISYLQPSEEVFETNTYYSQIKFTSSITQSIQPKGTSVVTSYIALDDDDLPINDLITQDLTKTQYFPYSNLNTLHDINGNHKIEASIIPSQEVYTQEQYSEQKETDSSYLINSIALNNENIQESIVEDKSAINIYATKTYLTTFTYFTTILKTNQKNSSSTVINSHTRVVENVVTESIPNYYLDMDAYIDLKNRFKLLEIKNNINKPFTTLAKLKDGQLLEITAVNTLNNLATVYDENDNNTNNNIENDFSDSDTAASDTEEVYIDRIDENNGSNINNTVTNSSLPSKKNDHKVQNLFNSFNFNGFTALRPVLHAMADLMTHNFAQENVNNKNSNKKIPNNDNNLKNTNNNLPVLENNSKEYEKQRSPIYIPVQDINIDNINTKLLRRPGSKNLANLHISPPDNWNIHQNMKHSTQLDIKIDKPKYETPLLNGGIPISPGEIITANSDVIVGKSAGIRPRVPFNKNINDVDLLSKESYLQQNIVPLVPPSKFSNNPDNNVLGMLRPPLLNSNSHMHPLPTTSLNLESSNEAFHQNKPVDHNNNNNNNNEIIEIKPIPQVYSTDLRPIEINYITSNNDPMVVNMKPPNKGNIYTPHNSPASIVFIENTHHQLHKNGQYFNEPSPYSNTVLNNISVSKHQNIKTPILSNQKIYLDSNILNHNIAMHVPPLTFIEENDLPHKSLIKEQVNNLVKNPKIISDQNQQKYLENDFKYKQKILPTRMVAMPSQYSPKNYPNIKMINQNLPNIMRVTNYQIPSKKQHLLYPPENNRRPYNNIFQQSISSKPWNNLENFNQQQVLENIPNRQIIPIRLHHSTVGSKSNPQQHSVLSRPRPINPYNLSTNKMTNFSNKNHPFLTKSFETFKNHTQINILPISNGIYNKNINNQTSHSETDTNQSFISEYPFSEDYENEEGEVVQESNPLPVTQDGKITDTLNKTNTLISYNNYNTKTSQFESPLPSAINELSYIDKTSIENSKNPIKNINNNNNNNNTLSSSKKPDINLDHIKISLPMGIYIGDSINKESPSQTETPFNPEHTDKNRIHSSLVTEKMNPITRPPPPPNNLKIELNQLESINSGKIDQDKESSEIFDFKESINPHNNEYINNFELSDTVYNNNNNNNNNNRKPMTQYTQISEPSINMKPPPLPINFKNDEVVLGLNPPPPPPPPLSTSTSTLTTTQLNYKLLERPTQSTTPKYKIYENQNFQNNFKSIPTTTTTTTTTHKSILNKYKTIYRQKQPSIIIDNDIKNNQTNNLKEIPITDNIKENVYSERPILSVKRPILDNLNPTPSLKVIPFNQNKTKNSTPIIIESTTQSNNNDNYLIESSEYSIYDDRIETKKTTTNLPTTLIDNKTKNSYKILTRTRQISKILIPTKYVTNTQTLTILATKTTVIHSQGIPSTQTLTLVKTKTTTIIDTVTETETQTLFQFTEVTITPSPIKNNDFTINLNTKELQNYEIIPNNNDIINHNINDDKKNTNEDPERNFIEIIVNNQNSTKSNISNHTSIISNKIKSKDIESIIHKENSQNNTLTKKLLPDIIENESIFVVMTDPKMSGIIDNNLTYALNMPGNNNNNDFNLPIHNENIRTNENNDHVLLGGILITSSPKLSEKLHIPDEQQQENECKKNCKAVRNELCHQNDGQILCICRTGFARMFSDRPCRTIYSYIFNIPVNHIGNDYLTFNNDLMNNKTKEFLKIQSIAHESLDRMIMQSNFRDIYHNINIEGFEPEPNKNGIIINAHLQLYENNDQTRLIHTFSEYLKYTNFSIGGTDLYTSQTGIEALNVTDFDECQSNHFHDCSENAHCFNLHGTYTCSCKEGYTDISENSIYPGRICSAELIGCEKCHYHGTCYTLGENENFCNCFHWYAGSSCQVNLKILLIALVSVGMLLLILLLFSILITWSKRRKAQSMQTFLSGINIIPQKNRNNITDTKSRIDKRAMIKDSSSETSHNSDLLPYKKAKETKGNQTTQQLKNRKTSQIVAHAEIDRRASLLEQTDRSLTVMIPRAKYHPISHISMDNSSICPGEIINAPSNNVGQSKVLSYVDVGSKLLPNKRNSISSINNTVPQVTSTGALVSAGYEVSAIVAQDTDIAERKQYNIQKISRHNDSLHLQHSADIQSQYSTFKNNDSQGSNLNSMDEWLHVIHQNDLTVSEARSYAETTVQPQTKSLGSIYEKQLSHVLNDEANTMAERDIGSTFLLPHTHLYKPDKGSDVSGFDSF